MLARHLTWAAVSRGHSLIGGRMAPGTRKDIIRALGYLLGVIGVLSIWLLASLPTLTDGAAMSKQHWTGERDSIPQMLPPASSGWSLVSDIAGKNGRQLELSVTGVGTDSGTVTRKLDHIGY